MKKNKIITSLLIIFIISLIYPSIKSNARKRNDLKGEFKKYIDVSERDLYETRELMCIHRGVNSTGTFKLVNTLKIGGEQSTNRSRAIMALIAAYSNGLKNDNAGTSHTLGGINYKGLYWNSYSQNAMWKYWKTFYNSSGFKINQVFSKTSDPYDSNTAKKLLERANAYYMSLQEDNIKIKLKQEKGVDWGYKKYEIEDPNHCHKKGIAYGSHGEDCYDKNGKLTCTSDHSYRLCSKLCNPSYDDTGVHYKFTKNTDRTEYDYSNYIVGTLQIDCRNKSYLKKSEGDKGFGGITCETSNNAKCKGWITEIPSTNTEYACDYSECDEGRSYMPKKDILLKDKVTIESLSTNPGKKKFYLVFDKQPENLKVTICYKMKEYDATLGLYRYTKKDGIKQNLLIANADPEPTTRDISRTIKFDDEEENEVSIEKIVVAVGKGIEISNGGLHGKIVQPYKWDNETNNITIFPDENKNAIYSTGRTCMGRWDGDDLAPNKQWNINTQLSSKLENPVEISPGDYVVYKVSTYRNSGKAKYKIIDKLNQGEIVGIYEERSILHKKSNYDLDFDIDSESKNNIKYTYDKRKKSRV